MKLRHVVFTFRTGMVNSSRILVRRLSSQREAFYNGPGSSFHKVAITSTAHDWIPFRKVMMKTTGTPETSCTTQAGVQVAKDSFEKRAGWRYDARHIVP